jgi:RNA polymerase sigma-70 factor, ECF subfamily
VAIWRDLPSLRDASRFDAWSYRLLVRAAHAEARSARRRIPRFLRDRADPTLPDAARAVEDRDQIERAFRRLTLDHRAVVVLHHVGRPLTEVAETLGIPTGTAHSRLHHAKRSLRAALEADLRASTVPALPKETTE